MHPPRSMKIKNELVKNEEPRHDDGWDETNALLHYNFYHFVLSSCEIF